MFGKEYRNEHLRLYERNTLVIARRKHYRLLLVPHWFGADEQIWGVEPDTRSVWRRWMDELRYPEARSRRAVRAIILQGDITIAVGRYVPRLARDLYEG